MSNETNSENGTRTASAMYSIAKGASTGGLKGAAVGAGKAYLPEIAKVAVVIICALIFLPTLIFTALPNFMFGFDSAQSDEIIAMTEQANRIDSAYAEVRSIRQSEIDRIVGAVTAAHTSENGYSIDEVEVNNNTGNTNTYWLIAITSVAYQQDLFSMDESSVRNMALRMISYIASIVTTTEGEGDYAVTANTLIIDIADMSPESLMDDLGFDEEARNWALLIYSTMTETQNMGIGDFITSGASGSGHTGTGSSLAGIVFTDAAPPVVYFNQFDPRWANIPFGRSGTIGTSGCGPTSLAMIVASLRDSSITPVEVARWTVANGFRAEGNGSYRTLMTHGGRHYGLNVEPIGRDARRLVEALQEGKLAIAIMSRGHFTRGGHYIVLRGVTADGQILVADSGSVSRSNRTWPLSIIVNEASRSNAAGGPFWVFS